MSKLWNSITCDNKGKKNLLDGHCWFVKVVSCVYHKPICAGCRAEVESNAQRVLLAKEAEHCLAACGCWKVELLPYLFWPCEAVVSLVWVLVFIWPLCEMLWFTNSMASSPRKKKSNFLKLRFMVKQKDYGWTKGISPARNIHIFSLIPLLSSNYSVREMYARRLKERIPLQSQNGVHLTFSQTEAQIFGPG